MIITMKRDADPKKVRGLLDGLETHGVKVFEIIGTTYSVYGLTGDTTGIDDEAIRAHKCVKKVVRIAEKYKLVGRLLHPEDSVIKVGDIPIGGDSKVQVIAGPCSIENESMLLRIAEQVKEAGATLLRGGAYKPRTSPYAFQGLGTEGIRALVKAREVTGMPVVSELMNTDKIDEFEENVDLIQIGARNMQNFGLLKDLGKRTTKPIMLKRGFSNTIEEWIMCAEYIVHSGNPNVIFCERGIRTFETQTRNTLDPSVVQIIKQKTHLPIVIDPSHAAGTYKLVEPSSLAAIATKTDGLMIEAHDDPENALSDGPQCIKPERLRSIIAKGKKIAEAVGREM
ncbi:MAG: 3-deoxy-7-phosphoheptulonate synthase [Bifidobacteriaceae bacterium]|jgi:3-deoxy-7-phosphoheptulonate synthase|nr:3-deoxy-7-phosphoheptulonate synthase [Bifidobacteriaceae bacterium]